MAKFKGQKPDRANQASKSRASKDAAAGNYQDAFAVEQKAKDSKSKFSSNPCRMKKACSSNDPNWYFKDVQNLSDVASFSFRERLGAPVRYNQVMPGYYVHSDAATIPGLMALRIAPICGVALDAQSPVNLAATNVYNFVRYKNSGAKVYDPSDLMMYLLAMDSIYACWNWMKRIYGMVSTFSQQNAYIPRLLLEANNIDYDNICENLANFRAYLNIKADEISAFCVPGDFTLNLRHSWLFSSVFKDSDTDKAQLYMYVPEYFYYYSETYSSSGGSLLPAGIFQFRTPAGTGKWSFADLTAFLNMMLEAVQSSEDLGVMSGDILKAYGDSNLIHVSKIADDYKIEPVYNPEVLSQIENASVFNWSPDDMASFRTFKVTQNRTTNTISCQPILATYLSGDPIYRWSASYLNFHKETVTPQDVIVATRLKATADILDTGEAVLQSCGSEVCTGLSIYGYAATANFTNDNPTLTLKKWDLPSKMADFTDGLRAYVYASLWSKFDWAPMLQMFCIIGDTTIAAPPLWDFDNFTMLYASNIQALNQLAILSEFNVPN